MNSLPNPFVGLSEHEVKETIQALRDARVISSGDNSYEQDGLKTSIPSICAIDRNEIEMNDLENRVIQRIKHSPLAKLLNKHFAKLHIVTSLNKDVKE